MFRAKLFKTKLFKTELFKTELFKTELFKTSFLEKYAKLVTKVENATDGPIFYVYDDELDANNEIMWMETEELAIDNLLDALGIFNDDEEEEESVESSKIREAIEKAKEAGYKKVLFVPIIEFDNNAFFKMPKERQDRAGTVLLMKFIKYYKENYAGIPVSASFANYDLQEKFIQACQGAGAVFPEISAELVKRVSKESYEQSTKYNMPNRRKTNDFKELLKTKFSESGIELSDNLSFTSTKMISEVVLDIKNLVAATEEDLKDVEGNITAQLTNRIPFKLNGEQIEYLLPIDDSKYYGSVWSFRPDGFYDFNSGNLEIAAGTETRIAALKASEIFKQLFSTSVTEVMWGSFVLTFDQFINDEILGSSRLRKVRGV